MNTIETSDSRLPNEEMAATNEPTSGGMQAAARLAAVAGVAALASESAHAAVAITSTSKPLNRGEAWRFLTQATFGPSEDDLKPGATLMSKGYVAWLNEQFLKQPQASTYNLSIRNRYCVKPFTDLLRRFEVNHDTTISAIWEQFLTGPDQLRQRVAFALSEIMVVSLREGFNLVGLSLAVASYHDMLAKNAFGSFRTLIKDVCRHPAMGDFLSHLGNLRPRFDTEQLVDSEGRLPTLRIPDQNFARELMQLFTIGLVQLNMDGSPVLKNGNTVDTYTQKDIEVLSYVFTGWFWDLSAASGPAKAAMLANPATISDALVLPENPTDTQIEAEFNSKKADYWPPMSKLMVIRDELEHAQYTDYQRGFGSSQLVFLGKPFTPTGTAMGDLDAALNILLNHQNVAPFIARQMIQRLVTSNPSPAYIRRVATQFKASNLSIKTLVQAILLDTEARDTARVVSETAFGRNYGKLREPVLRVTAALRALGFDAHKHIDANENKKCYIIPPTFRTGSSQTDPNYIWSDSTMTLGQGPYQAPSVFNFFRPGYIVPNTSINAPEFQASSGVELTAYIDFVEAMLDMGGCGYYYWNSSTFMPPPLVGSVNNLIPENYPEPGLHGQSRKDMRLGVYYKLDKLLDSIGSDAAGATPLEFSLLLNKLNDMFFGGGMSSELRGELKAVLGKKFSNTVGNLMNSSPYERSVAIKQCLFLVLVSPEFVVQR